MFLSSLGPLSSLILYLQWSYSPPHQVTYPQGHTLNFVFTDNFIISVSGVLLSNHYVWNPDSKSLISLGPQARWSYHLLLSFNPFIPHAFYHVLNYLISWLKSYDSSLSCLNSLRWPSDKNLSASSIFGKWSQKALVGIYESQTWKGRKWIKGVFWAGMQNTHQVIPSLPFPGARKWGYPVHHWLKITPEGTGFPALLACLEHRPTGSLQMKSCRCLVWNPATFTVMGTTESGWDNDDR